MPKRPTAKSDRELIGTRDGLVRAYGCSRTTVDRWLLRPGFPKGPPWNRADVDRFLDSFGSRYAPHLAHARPLGRRREPTDSLTTEEMANVYLGDLLEVVGAIRKLTGGDAAAAMEIGDRVHLLLVKHGAHHIPREPFADVLLDCIEANDCDGIEVNAPMATA